MVLNIPILLVQTLANGAVIPRAMMYAPYKWASHISPMYYSVQAYFANLFGSASVSHYLLGLAVVGLVAMVINIVIVWKLHKPLPIEQSIETARM